jgi:hypothetical protein
VPSRTTALGLVLIVAAIILSVLMGAWLISGYREESLRRSGLMLGAAMTGLVALPLLGGGVFLLLRGRGETSRMAELKKEQRLLSMVRTQGRVSVSEAALQLDVSRETLKRYLHDLVGKQLFQGYVNWDQDMLYALDASGMGSGACPNCGGKLELAGKGVIQCPYCGTEIFH